ncbi:unnamed protein product [Sympodiomycopsis kandeliae]
MTSAAIDKVSSAIDSNKDGLIARLAEAIEIPSISGSVKHRPQVVEMAKWMAKSLEKVGCENITLKELGNQTLDGVEVGLPPVVFADYKAGEGKKTILVYGHYDVQPALKSDGWNTEPFKLVHDEKTGRLYGRGSTDDKGPIIAWINAIEAHHKAGVELPVNLKFIFEGMEESGSVGLDELIAQEYKTGTFLKGVDAACISDNYWLGTKKPCITHGLRGVAYFKLHISGPGADLHSGLFGGVVHEPMTDLFSIMSKLVTPTGEILIPGIKELVAPLTDEEFKRYEVMAFTAADMHAASGSETTISNEKEKILMSRMRYPSLSLHGIEGAFSEPGTKTVIPAKVIGKFSLRLVPDMTPEKVNELVTKFVESEWKKLNSKNTLHLEPEHGGKPWLADPNHWNYEAAIKATEKIYNTKPDLTREGGSIPVALTIADTLQRNLLLLPMGRADDGAHSTNEKIDIDNYIQGSKLLGAYLHEVAAATGS